MICSSRIPPPLSRYSGGGEPFGVFLNRHPRKTLPGDLAIAIIGPPQVSPLQTSETPHNATPLKPRSGSQSELPPYPLLLRPSHFRRFYQVVGSVLGRRFCFADRSAMTCCPKETAPGARSARNEASDKAISRETAEIRSDQPPPKISESRNSRRARCAAFS